MPEKTSNWKPDGWDAEVRIGILTPHADIGPESELHAMAPAHVGIHAARVLFGAMTVGGAMNPTIPLAPVRAFAEPPHVDEATERLAEAPLNAIAFAFTSSAYMVGAEGEAAMLARLMQRARGIPVVATGTAAVDALRRLGARRIALVHPPWFDAELNGLGRAYYEAVGFEVSFAAPSELPSNQHAITPEGLFNWVVDHVPEEAQAVVIGGNGFRAVGVIAALEEALLRPVLAANQVVFWAALRAAGADASTVTGYGRLFTLA